MAPTILTFKDSGNVGEVVSTSYQIRIDKKHIINAEVFDNKPVILAADGE
ncbi:MAG: hypothetical protein V5A72_00280 [Candidatus Nanohaloarchaea archaeon]